MAKNDPDLQELFDKETDEMDEGMQELLDKVSRKVYGVGTEIRNLTNVEEDIPLELLEQMGQVSFDTSKKHLLDIQGRDSETNMDLDEAITQALDDLKNQITMDPTYQERVLLEQEYNYICAQMPQLLWAIESKVDNILSPDGITKSYLSFDVTKGEEKITESDIRDLAQAKDLEEFLKETIVQTFISGTKYIYTVPYKKIARRILKNYGEKRGKMVKDSPDLSSSPSHNNITKEEEELFRESLTEVVYDDDGDDIEYFKESINLDDEVDQEIVFTEDYLLGEAKDEIAFMINECKEELIKNYDFLQDDFSDDFDGEKLFSEARKPFYNLTGCHIDLLDNQRCIPVVINREVIGVYYIENKEYFSSEDAAFNISNMTGTGHVADTYDRERREGNIMRRKTIIKKVADIIDRNLNKRFIKKNRKILNTVESVLDENEYFRDDLKIRFIPRKYLVPFTVNKDNEGLGRSQVHRARIMAHLWILLNYSNAMNKFFHEKDKILIEAKSSVSTDISSMANRALKSVTDIYPLPNQLLDITETHGRLADVGRVIVPVSKNGNKAFEIDKVPGQEREQDYEFKNELEQIATTLVGTPYSLLDINSNTDYATNLLSQDKREVQKSISFQIQLEKPISEFFTKLVKYEKDIDAKIHAKLPTPKGLSEDKQNQVIRDLEDKIQTIVDNILGQDADPELRAHLQKELFKKETSAKIDWNQVEKIVDKFKARQPDSEGDEEPPPAF